MLPKGMTNMFETTIYDQPLKFETNESLFSYRGVDEGTEFLLSTLELTETDKVLDLGCGYGAMGIAIAKKIPPSRVYMSDIDPVAVECTEKNIHLNGVEGIQTYTADAFDFDEDDFTLIVSNPPYHTDFSVAKEFITQGHKRLVIGGAMVIVVKRLLWYKNKMTSVFGNVRIAEHKGYYVLKAVKKAKVTQSSHEHGQYNKSHSGPGPALKTTRKHTKKIGSS